MMSRLFRIFLFFSLCSLFFIIRFPLSALASAEFETSYQVRYQVNVNGTAQVNQDISLTNKLSNVYATQYTLSFESTKITNIKLKALPR